MSDSARTRPATASWAAGLLLLEALGMLALAGWTTITALNDPPEHIAGGIFLAALAAGAAFFLLQVGRAMLDGKQWSRAGAVVWQVLQLGVAVGTFNGGEGPVPIALVLAALAVTVFTLVLRKSVTLWLNPDLAE